MRVLLLISDHYTLAKTFADGFMQNGCEVMSYDAFAEVSRFPMMVHGHIGKVPNSFRVKWYAWFVRNVNERHLECFNRYKPDIVLAYNSQLLLPETVKMMKRTSKMCFFLGDSPFYTPQNDFYLPCLKESDHIFCPDSYWEKQFRGMGFPNVHYFILGSNPQVNHPVEVSEEEKKKWESDLVFVGVPYMTAVGFKRALFLNYFSGMDIKIYTSRKFDRWFTQFPELQKRVIFPEKRLSDHEVNTILNCCKIYPVDANPGLLNGIHLRIFDCIASGILPLAEYRKDVLTIFGKQGLPIIRNYSEAAAQAQYYIDHENERQDIVGSLRSFVDQNYSPEKSIRDMLSKVSND